MEDHNKVVTIGGACAFWGDTLTSTQQLLCHPELNYLVYDYLAEVTLSIMAGQKMVDPSKGYALDFVRDTIAPHREAIEKNGVKIIANAGGVNPKACGEHLQQILASQNSQLTVAVVLGDDVMPLFSQLKSGDIEIKEPNQNIPNMCLTLNAYTGYRGIKKALELGADIIVTGRTADSALTLGILMYEFGWNPQDFTKMSYGSLAGHIIECGAQATGGNFTDWDTVNNPDQIGFPIVECYPSGDFYLTKPHNTGGIISNKAVAEQLIYEIADPKNYFLPDVICDWSHVTLTEKEQKIHVQHAFGKPPTGLYKFAGTFVDGFKTSTAFLVYGIDSALKAQQVAVQIQRKVAAAFSNKGWAPFSQYNWDIIGTGATSGEHQMLESNRATEVVLKISATHAEKQPLVYFSKELAQASTSLTPGLCQLSGGRPKVHPMIKLYTFLASQALIEETVIIGETSHTLPPANAHLLDRADNKPATKKGLDITQKLRPSDKASLAPGENVQLIQICHGRSGDKGDHANIGIIARAPEYWPVIQQLLTPQWVASVFIHHLDKPTSQVERFELPGIYALNFMLYNALGDGGFASLRLDSQGKGFAQLLLSQWVQIPTTTTNADQRDAKTSSSATANECQ